MSSCGTGVPILSGGIIQRSCYPGDKEIEIGVAASTSLLIGLLVSLTEVCIQDSLFHLTEH